MDISVRLEKLKGSLPDNVKLVAVSKTYPSEDIMTAYGAGQRVFGESRPQELRKKYEELPKDIEWHMIGHLQTNKVKYIAPFVNLIHSVDSLKLLEAINKEALKNHRVIDVLLEVFIAEEETKHGWSPEEILKLPDSEQISSLTNVNIRGLMGLATYTDDTQKVKREFTHLHDIFTYLQHRNFGKEFDILSMGMSSDYPIAIECGSTMVRIGSSIFGERDYGNG